MNLPNKNFIPTSRAAFLLLSKLEKSLSILLMFCLFILNILDILAILILSYAGSLFISGESLYLGDYMGNALNAIEGFFPFVNNPLILFFLSLSLLILKTFLSLILMKKVLDFLASKQVKFSNEMMERLLSNFSLIKVRTESQKIVFALTDSVNSIFTGILFPLINILSDAFLAVLLFFLLFFTSPQLTFLNFTILLLIMFSIKKISILIHRSSDQYASSLINSRQIATETLGGVREISVYKAQEVIKSKFFITKVDNASSYMKISFLQSLPKYIFEIVLVLLSACIIFWGYFAGNREDSLSLMLIFIASAYRIFPAILRLQSNFLQIKFQQPSAEVGLTFFNQILQESTSSISPRELMELAGGPDIIVASLSFSYPNSENKLFDELNLLFPANSLTVLHGPSGVGKSSILNIILGFVSSNEFTGQILVNGTRNFLSNFSNISYVPQKPFIFSGTLLENITFQNNLNNIDIDSLNESLDKCGLGEFVLNLPLGLETYISSLEPFLSGGEVQRLCIARAFYFNPKVLVLDESLNALDLESEKLILTHLKDLSKSCTIIMVSHGENALDFADYVLRIGN